MPIYVDDTEEKQGLMKLCYMTADSLEELHVMAKKLERPKESCFYGGDFPYYKICKSKRKLAVKYGAVELTNQELLALMCPAEEHDYQDEIEHRLYCPHCDGLNVIYGFHEDGTHETDCVHCEEMFNFRALGGILSDWKPAKIADIRVMRGTKSDYRVRQVSEKLTRTYPDGRQVDVTDKLGYPPK